MYPDVTFPMVVVGVAYPGASPSEVENLISRPVEDAVFGLNGIDRVRSFSRDGFSQTWVIFQMGVDLDNAANLVRESVAQIRSRLPEDARDPAVARLDVSAAPIAIYTLGGARSLSEARKFAEEVIKPALEQLPGVAAVNVQGGGVREIQIELDRAKLDGLSLTPGMVAERLRAENLNVPAGHFEEGRREVNVRTVGEFPGVEAIRGVIVATAPHGASVRVRDVGMVVDGFEEERTLARVNGTRTVTFDVVKRSGQNTVAVADSVEQKLAELAPKFPSGTKASLIVDQARFVRESVGQVEHDLLFGGAMAVLVILFFMLDLRSTIISGIALPTSIVGTFFFIYVLGYTLNMMTLLALSLSIGLLIDDAVVVRENIFKQLERGKAPMQAALDGTREITLAVLATTATVVAMFLPVAFVSGMVGQFFRQFGHTVIAAVVLSMLVAFTLDPMLSARFSKMLQPGQRESFAGLKRPFRWFFANLDATYRVVLGWSLGHKFMVGAIAIASMFLVGFLMKQIGADFVNAEDRGQFVVEVELGPGTSLDETSKLSARAEDEYRKNPEVRTLLATIGPLGEVNKARWRVITSPKNQRTVGLPALENDAREVLRRVLPDAKVIITDPPFVEGAAAEAPIMINVRGEDYGEILPVAREIGDILKATGAVQDINVRYSPGRPELRVAIDRERAADRGLAVAPLAMALRGAMEGDEAGQLRLGGDQIPIRVRLQK
ncbi:MAG: efflux RND transporter permease subunit, partial [Thermoleophilaceae bacterium]